MTHFLQRFMAIWVVLCLGSWESLNIYAQEQQQAPESQQDQQVGDALADESSTDENGEYKVKISDNKENPLALKNLLQAVTLIAIGMIGYKTWAHCKPITLSMKLFIGAAIVYIGSEVYAMLANDKANQDIQDAMVGTGKHQQQIAALEQAANMKEKQADTLKTKANLQLAASVGFFAAAGLASSEFGKAETAHGKCMQALTTLGGVVKKRVAQCLLMSVMDASCAIDVPAGETIFTGVAKFSPTLTTYYTSLKASMSALNWEANLIQAQTAEAENASLVGAMCANNVTFTPSCTDVSTSCGEYIKFAQMGYVGCSPLVAKPTVEASAGGASGSGSGGATPGQAPPANSNPQGFGMEPGPSGAFLYRSLRFPEYVKTNEEKMSDWYLYDNQYRTDKYSVSMIDNFGMLEREADLVFAYQEWNDFYTGKLSSPSIEHYEKTIRDTKREMNPIYLDYAKNKLISLMKAGVDFVIPSAHAGDTSILTSLGIVGVVLVLLTFFEVEWGSWLLNFVGDASTRAGLFATFGGFGAVVNLISRSSIKKLRSQAADYREQARKLRGKDKIDGYAQNMGGPAKVGVGSPKITAAKFDDASIDGQHCSKKPTPNNPTGSDPNCTCKQQGTCASINIPQGELTSIGGSLGTVVASAGAQTASIANDINQGRFSDANLKASKLNSSAARVKKAAEAGLNNINKIKQAMGQRPIDFDGFKNKLTNSVLRKGKNKFDSAGGLAALAKNSPPAGLANAIVGEVDDKDIKKLYSAKGIPNIGTTKTSSKAKDMDFGVDFNDDFTDVAPAEQRAVSSEKALEGFDLGNNEILEREDVNLFDVITNRYRKSIDLLFNK